MIGQPIPRFEDRRFVRGQGQYTDDLNVEGQAYAYFLRSPHPHALIRAIDTSEASAAPGVIKVLIGQDYLDDGHQGIEHIPNPADAIAHDRPAFAGSLTGSVFSRLHVPLVVDKVRHVGEPVALVIAETALQARDAAELIFVDYDSLPAVVQADDAMAPGAPQLWDEAPGNLCFQVQIGDRERARQIFAGAFHVVRREFRNSRIVNCQMEPRAAIGCHDAATGDYTLISGSQGAVRLKMALAAALRMPAEKIRVVCPDVGGGFGPRTFLYVEQLAVLWAARRAGRPVKWTGDRSEAFVSDYQGRDCITRVAMAFAEDGRILAIDNEWLGNVGAHTVSYVPMSNGTRIMTTVYHVPVAAVHVSAVLSNTVPTVAYRGAGRPEATHMMERMLDIAAREMNIDRIDIRRRNLVQRDMLPYRSAMGLNYDSGDFVGNMDRALDVCDWNNFAARREAARKDGRLLGIGLANYIESPVGAPRERIVMTVLADGKIDIIAGTQSTGQGHETTFIQVVATHLGVSMEAVKLRTGDTAFVSVGGGTHSDRSMRLGGMLLVQAIEQIIETGKPVAALLLGVPAEDIEYAEAEYRHAGKVATLFDVARHIGEHGLPGDAARTTLSATTEFTGRISAHPTGSAVCELAIDPDTGHVSLLQYTSIDDVGKPINPMIVEGQVHGGLAQGIGQAFLEGYYVDRETGQVMSGSYMDYGVAHAENMPPLKIELTEDPTTGNPLGVKGGGESGITPATAAIFNALADALRDIGTDELAMPATPQVIWDYIHQSTAQT